MPKLCIYLGILLIAAGIVVPFAGPLTSLPIPGLSEPRAEDVCRPGETLQKSSGVVSILGGNRGFGLQSQYGCVTPQGQRRDVTTSVLAGVTKDASTFTQQILGTAMLSTVLPMAGSLLLVIGIVGSIRRGIASGKVRVVTPMYADVTDRFTQSRASDHTTPPSDAATRLQQLQGMLDAQLISESEFQTKRAEILREL